MTKNNRQKRGSGKSPPKNKQGFSVKKFYILTEAFTRILRTAVRCALGAWFLWLLYRSIEVLAGNQTGVDLGVRLIAKMDISKTVLALALLVASCWGAFERRLRKTKVANLSKRLLAYETRIDPGRSSSKLLIDGTPRKEDQ